MNKWMILGKTPLLLETPIYQTQEYHPFHSVQDFFSKFHLFNSFHQMEVVIILLTMTTANMTVHHLRTTDIWLAISDISHWINSYLVVSTHLKHMIVKY